MRHFDTPLIDNLCQQSQQAPRRRAHHLIHADHSDPVQRLLIALQPDSYVQPHRHTQPPIWEHLVCLRGAIAAIGFDEQGQIQQHHQVRAGSSLEIAPAQWHTIIALETDSVILEYKPGPFQATAAENFANWAPTEGDPAVPEQLRAWLNRMV